jgi:hypothetical protein
MLKMLGRDQRERECPSGNGARVFIEDEPLPDWRSPGGRAERVSEGEAFFGGYPAASAGGSQNPKGAPL